MCPRSTARFPSRRRGRATGRRRRRHAYVLRRWQGDLIRGKPPGRPWCWCWSVRPKPLQGPRAALPAGHLRGSVIFTVPRHAGGQRRNPEQICCFWHSPLVTARIFFTSRYYVETVSYSACVAVPSGRRLLSPQFIENFLLLLSLSGRRVDVRNDPSCDSKFSSVEE
ncbi:hypothetical protein PVAP13_6NG345000 [Panicum virgatum]|uniref:Uncharacterized protein n=1 Tax=Panicum virgatum TaxID=38727 RepID=A0A8T0R581_PANVG|nr:hypothetical protein PVAP13_6NG345000 [Panicum virgatum]